MMSCPPKAALFLQRGRRSIPKPQCAPHNSYFSTHANANVNENDTDASSSAHPQSFVQSDIHLEPGESSLPPNFHQRLRPGPSPPSHQKHSQHANDGKDAYWRPPWKNRAEIISAQDFANRPRVTFSENFETMHDAMIVLSWLSEDDRMGMYRLYLDMMAAMAGKGGKNKSGATKAAEDAAASAVSSTNTSHEYVIRVVAQKYNVTTSRAAGVIQLQHNEEQFKKDPKFKVRHDVQAHVDAMVREQIRECYQSYGEKDPLQFVEDPVASTNLLGREDTISPTIQRASDLVDIDALFKQTKLNEEDEAKIKIKNHIYFEDVDDAARNVKIDGEAKKLLKKGMEMGQIYDDDESNHNDSTNADDAKEVEANKPRTKVPTKSAYTPFPENNTQTTRRPRWKFAAQIINTDKINAKGKKSGARIKAKRHGRMVDGNTLIEEAGSLRVATVEELESTSWKHVRNESEFMFQGVKDAWLKRELMGEVGGWGVQEEVNEVVDLGEEEGGEGEKEEGAESEEGGEGEGEEEEEGNTESDKEKE